MIKHNTSTVIVFQSIDYKDFTMIKGNRGLNEVKINRIIKEIENGNDMLKYYPIQVRVVNDKLQILDGQHRFYICKKLKRPVHYIIVSEAKSMVDIAKINSNVEKWTAQNFINCYVSNNNSNYKKLQAFLDSYKISVGTSLVLLSTGGPEARERYEKLNEKFEHGSFEISHWDQAVEFAEDCKLFNASSLHLDRNFMICIHRIKTAGLISIKELSAAVRKYPDMLEKQMNYKGYIVNLEAIVNKNKQKRIFIT